MLRAQTAVTDSDGEALGALIVSPQRSARRRQQLQSKGSRQRRVRIDLDTVFEEEDSDLSFDVKDDDECSVSAPRKRSHLSFADQLKGGLGLRCENMPSFIVCLLFFVVSFVVAFSYNDIEE